MSENLSPRPPLFVAEISGNHNGSLDRALDIVRAMAAAGAQAVKLQTYTADTITLNVDSPAFRISGDHELWGSRKLYDLYEEAHTPWEWHKPIFELASELGMIAFSTPFDESAVEFLENLNVPLYKIASIEIIDLPLIKLVAQTGKPIIISVGTGTLAEVAEAVAAAREGGARDITLLACTSSYPARPDDANLRRMSAMSDIFGVKVGLSDHTLGLGVSIAAATLGASVIEKHVTLSRADGGVDSAFSMEPAEVRLLVDSFDEAVRSLGSASAWKTAAESESLRLRPSLYVTQNVQAGDIISDANIRSVRPAGGLPPKYLPQVLGKVFSKSAEIGTPLDWNLIN